MVTSPITVGRSVTVRVPASAANLGPGFDCLGLSLALYDEVTLTATDGGLRVRVQGEGNGAVPLDETHLVVRAVRSGLQLGGLSWPQANGQGLDVLCRNAIPHSRGLGSSASAVVVGLAAACALLGTSVTDTDLIQRSSEFEGHPDNASASVLGGAVVSWTDPGPRYYAAPLQVHPDVLPVALVPLAQSCTEETRDMLPRQVSHADAAFNAGRSALAVLALSTRPDLLLAATEDRLHQPQRAAVMAATAAMVRELREAGVAAVVSGAGPSVLALTLGGLAEPLRRHADERGWSILELPVAGGVQRI